MKIIVYVPQLDENRTDSTYAVTVDRAEALNRGCDYLGAIKVGASYYYKADETDEVYRLTAREVATLGAGQIDERGADYSLWCSETGVLVKRPSAAVKTALGLNI